jgi:DNA-binding MarR family transcriptional regulator
MQKTRRRKSICYCINLRRAAGSVTACYDRILSPSGLTINQYSLLVNLKRLGESNISGLADCVGLERTTLIRNIRPLLDRGYISDVPRTGARDRCLLVTDAGTEALDAAAPLWKDAQDRVNEKIGAVNVELLNKLLWELETL